MGLTTDLKRRLQEYSDGKSYQTSKFKPRRLVAYVAFSDRAKAKSFERCNKPMTVWIACVAGWGIAYLLGSIPTGYLAGKLLKGIDIRKHGSRSTGATNVLRTLGPWPAFVVLMVDLLKGAAAVIFARWFFPWLTTQPSDMTTAALNPQAFEPWVVCLAGLAALLGHSRSIWLGFSGGKSAATGLGVLLALSWPVGLGAAAVFALALAISRIVSLSSMLAALTAIILIFGTTQPLPYRLLVLAGGIYVIARHRANIRRLLTGQEPRLGQTTADHVGRHS